MNTFNKKNDARFTALGGLCMVLSGIILFSSVMAMGIAQATLGSIPEILEIIFITVLALPMLGLLATIIYGASKELFKLLAYFIN